MVARLSRQQIRLIKERISQEGVSTAELAEDLLDHLCTCIEEEMENGLCFEKAFEKVFNSLEEDELKLTEMKTQELLEGKKAYYPDLPQSFGLMALFVLWSVLIIVFAGAMVRGLDSQPFEEIMKADYYPFFIVISNLIIFAPVIAFAVREIKQTQGKTPVFSFRSIPAYVYPVVLCIALLSQFWMEPLAMLSIVPQEEILKNAGQLWKHGLIVVALVVVFNSILTELLFRGIILKGLLKTLTPVKAIFWSSLFFMIINFAIPLFMFTLGFMLGWIYWKTKSLYPTIFMLITGTLVGYCTLFFMGHPGDTFFRWQEWFGNIWLYAGVVAVSLLLTLGLFYYLHRKLSEKKQL
jgi:uncharacterized protein